MEKTNTVKLNNHGRERISFLQHFPEDLVLRTGEGQGRASFSWGGAATEES